MSNPLRIIFVLMSFAFCFGASAIAEETTEPAAGSPPSTVVKVTKAIEHGATVAVNGIKKGVKAGVHGVERGAAATGRVAKKVVRKVKGEDSPGSSSSESQ
jgi:hypothetical protein